MALTAHILIVSLCSGVFAAPFDLAPPSPSSDDPVIVTQIVTSSIQVVETATVVIPTTPPTPVAPTPPAVPPSIIPTVSSPVSQVITDIITVTATSTPPPVTVTISVPPATVTQTVITTPTPVPSGAAPSAQTTWAASPQMTDLSCFNISYFPYGQHNMAIVNGTQAPAGTAAVADVSAAAVAPTNGTTNGSPQVSSPGNSSSAALQLLYPAGSINPESEPQGGADFYASPLDLSNASNVTLEYSVFFPSDFDWVLAGKLPGLYGGHSGCSGGNDAKSCFSTRLMWRAKGVGELYLYAPKDKQTDALCAAPPQSVCDQAYGLSIGRGAFNFTPGAWTHVKQTVTLNTPGGQDGGFALEVDGRPVMNRTDVFYRDVVAASEPSGGGDGDGLNEDEPGGGGDGEGDDGGDDDGDNGDGNGGDDDGGDNSGDPNAPAQPSQTPTPAPPPPQPTSVTAPLDAGLTKAVPLLGPLLNGLYQFIASPGTPSSLLSLSQYDGMPLYLSGANSPAFILAQGVQNASQPASAVVTTTVVVEAATQTVSAQSTATAVVYVQSDQVSPSGELAVQAQSQGAAKAVGFSGLFFSSFFGGHEEKYASPKDQYTWFKDFAITING